MRFALSFVTTVTLIGTLGLNAAQGGLVLDFSSDSGVATSGGSVTGWTAATGGVTATSPTSFNEPTYASGIFASGQSGVLFNGNANFGGALASFMTFSDAALPSGTNPFTIAAVIQIPAYSATEPPIRPAAISWGTDGNGATPFELAALAVGRQPGGGDGPGRTLTYQENGTQLDSGLRVNQATDYIAVISRDSSGNVAYNLVSATSDLTATATGGNNSIVLNTGRIGVMLDTSDSSFTENLFSGYIGRLQVYDTQLTGADQQNAINGLLPYVTTVVPEPSTIALAAFGAIGLAVAGLRRRKRA